MKTCVCDQDGPETAEQKLSIQYPGAMGLERIPVLQVALQMGQVKELE